MFSTGFCSDDFLAVGVLDGTQKLGRCLSRPFAMLDTEGASMSSRNLKLKKKVGGF